MLPDAPDAPVYTQQLSKAYGSKQALNAVSFTVKTGELFGLIGLNGAGKTTLMKLLLDFTKPDHGHASLFTHPATHAAARKNLSYLPEKFLPPRSLTGREYMQLTAQYYGHKPDAAMMQASCRQLDLDPAVLSQRISTYSKGMAQKLGLASSFALPVPLLLLDEPMSGLDPRARAQLKQAMMLARAEGKTILFSTHILADVESLCDRIGVLHEGRLIWQGTPADLNQVMAKPSLEQAFLTLISAAALPA